MHDITQLDLSAISACKNAKVRECWRVLWVSLARMDTSVLKEEAYIESMDVLDVAPRKNRWHVVQRQVIVDKSVVKWAIDH